MLEQVCLGLVWESGVEMCTFPVGVCGGFGMYMLEGKQSRLFRTVEDLISISPDGYHHHSWKSSFEIMCLMFLFSTMKLAENTQVQCFVHVLLCFGLLKFWPGS